MNITQQLPHQQHGYSVMTISPAEEYNWDEKYPKRKMKIMGIAHLSIAGISVVTQFIVYMLVERPTIELCSGFWCGMVFALAGTVGMITSKIPGKYNNIFYMGLSILAAVFAMPMFAFTVLNMVFQVQDCVIPSYRSDYTTNRNNYYFDNCGSQPLANIFFYGIMILFTIAEFTLGIISAVGSGKIICQNNSGGCCSCSQNPNNSSVVYVAQQLPMENTTNSNTSSVIPPE